MAQELVGCDFCKFVNYEDSDDFYLYELGTNKCEPLYSYEHLVKNRIIIHFILNGKGIVRLNGKQYEVGPHQIFLIPQDTKTFYQADAEDPWEYIWFHIGGPKIPQILKEAGLTASHPVYTPMACAEEIEALAKDILGNYTRQYYCIGTLYKICDYLIENSSAKQEDDYDNSLLYVKNVISYIQLKYSEHVKIENIAQVAEAVGYTDTFTFSKAFKRHFHQSPSSCKGVDYSIATGMLGLARANIRKPQ